MGRATIEIVLDAGALAATVATIDRLARLRLHACRAGRALRLVHVSPELHELVQLAGLAEALGLEVRWQPEEREERLGLEEEGQLDDLPA